jgi:hypothetical protein
MADMIYRMSQEETSIFREAILVDSVFLNKNVYMYICTIPESFRYTVISFTVPKLLIRKRYYVLFLIPVFIVQVTKLVQFT